MPCVLLARQRPKPVVFVDPRRRVLAESDLAGARVDPCAPVLIGAGVGERVGCVSLGAERTEGDELVVFVGARAIGAVVVPDSPGTDADERIRERTTAAWRLHHRGRATTGV